MIRNPFGARRLVAAFCSQQTLFVPSRSLMLLTLLVVMASGAYAQLPSDAVELDKLKIPEVQKSVDLDPVYLTPSDPSQARWEYKGITYRGSKADSKEKFLADPDKYAKAAEKQRFINNFKTAMSTVWCPVTDQVTPGGMKQWKKYDLTFESCCGFCDENAKDMHFEEGLKRLNERAEQTYSMIGAKYTEGAKGPLAGALKKQ